MLVGWEELALRREVNDFRADPYDIEKIRKDEEPTPSIEDPIPPARDTCTKEREET